MLFVISLCAALVHAQQAPLTTVVLAAVKASTLTSFATTTALTTIHRKSAQDDSISINAGIQDALSRGLTEYVIPAGTYVLTNSIIIPAGTSNFTLRGAGKDKTVFTTPSGKMHWIVQVGSLFNSGYKRNAAIKLPASVKEGDLDILLPNGVSVETGKYYVLEDDYKITSSQDPSVAAPRWEIVKFTSFSPSTRRAVLESPAAREYEVNPHVTLAQGYVSNNITVQGMGLVGTLPNTTVDASDRIVYAWLVDHLTLRDLKVDTFQSAALEVEESRNVTIDDVNVSHAVDLGPGQGYGVIVKHSRFSLIQNSHADGCRHGFILHSGSTDALVLNCVASGSISNLDLHGYDERRVTFQSCTAGNSINIGNDKWLGGDKDIKIINCSLGGPIVLCPNARNIQVVNTDLWGFKLSSSEDPLSTPPGGFPGKVSFEDCYFRTAQGIITRECKTIGKFSFNRCTFEEIPTAWGTMFLITQIADGTMVFDRCKFIINSLRSSDISISLTTPSNNFNIVVRSSSFIHKGGGLCAVGTSGTYAGKTSLVGNRFSSFGAKNNPVFLKNAANAKVYTSGNAAQKAN